LITGTTIVAAQQQDQNYNKTKKELRETKGVA